MHVSSQMFKRGGIDEVCSLLVLVAQEQGDHQQATQLLSATNAILQARDAAQAAGQATGEPEPMSSTRSSQPIQLRLWAGIQLSLVSHLYTRRKSRRCEVNMRNRSWSG